LPLPPRFAPAVLADTRLFCYFSCQHAMPRFAARYASLRYACAAPRPRACAIAWRRTPIAPLPLELAACFSREQARAGAAAAPRAGAPRCRFTDPMPRYDNTDYNID